ncbi:acyl carrier protein [Streptomyces sp. S6]|nr:acyl carrier protein [Streptomyces sp. S6]
MRARFTTGTVPGRTPSSPSEEPSADATPAGQQLARLCELFGQSLGTPCGPRDSLFDLGGDSLTVTRLISSVHRELAAELTFQDVFDHPSPHELAQLVGGAGRPPGDSP